MRTRVRPVKGKDRAGWDGGRHGRGVKGTLPRFALYVQGSWTVRQVSLEVHRCVQKGTVLGQCCLFGARATSVFHHAELK